MFEDILRVILKKWIFTVFQILLSFDDTRIRLMRYC